MSIAEIITAVKGLTWRNVAQIWALLILLVPVGLLWWAVHDGSETIIDWRSGERIVRIVDSSCIVVEFRNSGKIRQRVIKNLESQDGTDVNLSIDSFRPFSEAQMSEGCSKLQVIKRRLDDEL